MTKLLWPILAITPLSLALAWGQHFAEQVYQLLRAAQNVSAGTGIVLAPVGDFPAAIPMSSLFALVLGMLARLSLSPSWAALFISAAGWTTASFTFLAIGQSLKRTEAALVAALLLSFSPAIISTLGSPAAWIIALCWLTVALLLRRRYVAGGLSFLLVAALLVPLSLAGLRQHLNLYGGAAAWSSLIFAITFGADWLAGNLVNRDRVRLSYSQTRTTLLAFVFIGLGILQGTVIWQLFQERPLAQWAVEEELAAWLSASTSTESTLLANGRTAYLAQRSLATMPELSQSKVAAGIEGHLKSKPLDFVVTPNTLPYKQLSESSWFRLSYEPVKQFNAPNLAAAPYTVWAFREPVAELGERQTINARVPDRLAILGYQIGSQQVQPGDSVQIALYMQAPEATSEPSIPFQAVIRLISPVDGSTVTDWEISLPQSISPADWAANETIIEQFSLTIPNALAAGAYQFNLSLVGSDAPEMWPFSLDKDINRLDRIPVGGLLIPWQGSLGDVQPLKTGFGDQIELAGFAATTAKPGESLDVSLYWQALQPIDDDYVVFVHVLNSAGELAANHDGRPENGRFPTTSWLPGIVIPDTHTIILPDDLPPGDYQLKAGLYRPETGERLAAVTADGISPADSAAILTTITIP